MTLTIGGHRARFQLESVLNLKQSLRAIGSDLLIAVGKPEEVGPGGYCPPYHGVPFFSTETRVQSVLGNRAWRMLPATSYGTIQLKMRGLKSSG